LVVNYYEGGKAMATVRLEHVTKRYGGVTAVDDVTLEVRSGEFFVLVGPSGCGKSTLLRLVAGLEEVTSGTIYITGEIVNHLPPRERDVAMVFESPNYALYPHLTTFDNMAFALRWRRGQGETGQAEGKAGGRAAREEKIRKRVEGVADRLGLGGLLNRRREELSTGHRQSAAFGKAMVRQPKVFLMDDPLSQVDSVIRASSHRELRELHRQMEATIIYVTHDQAEAMALGQRLAVMNEGVVQQVGTPQGLYDRPANLFVAGFIGSPPMNLFAARIEGSGDTMLIEERGFRLPVPAHLAERLADREGREIVLGLRPEHIRDARFTRDADRSATVSARIESREYLGSDVNLYLVAEGGTEEFVARVDSRTQARPGDQIEVVFDAACVHAFDPASGRSVL
jgi:multiple sugar transport system ATP-binding protein